MGEASCPLKPKCPPKLQARGFKAVEIAKNLIKTRVSPCQIKIFARLIA